MKGQIIQKFLPPTILALLNNKVDKVSGKQLSTEDYTTAEKTKLAGIEEGAEVNNIKYPETLAEFKAYCEEFGGMGFVVGGITFQVTENTIINMNRPLRVLGRLIFRFAGDYTLTFAGDYSPLFVDDDVQFVSNSGTVRNVSLILKRLDEYDENATMLIQARNVSNRSVNLTVSSPPGEYNNFVVESINTNGRPLIDAQGILTTYPLETQSLFQATSYLPGIMSEDDKAKLDGIEAGATNYQHPATHAPSIILQDADNRFMTDVERNKLALLGIPSAPIVVTPNASITLEMAERVVEVAPSTPTTLYRLYIPTEATTPFPLGTVIQLIPTAPGYTQCIGVEGVVVEAWEGRDIIKTVNSVATLIKVASDKWRLSGDLCKYTEVIEYIPPGMTANTIPAPYVASANRDAVNAYKAFSTNLEEYWQGTLLTDYVVLDLGTPQIVDSFEFYKSGSVDNVKTFTLEGSNDGITFTPLLNNHSITSSMIWHVIPVPNTTAYRYYKVVCIANFGGSFYRIYGIRFPKTKKINEGRASFKNGFGTFPAGTTYTVTDAFITAETLVTVSPTGTKTQNWSVESTAGSFTITAEAAEPSSVTFDWGAVK